MAKSRQQSRQRQRRQLKGGNDGWKSNADFAVDRYGGMDAQHSVVGSNTILATPHNGGGLVALSPANVTHGGNALLLPGMHGGDGADVPVLPTVVGGRKKRRGGAALLDDIAIPAFFVAANNMVKFKRSTFKEGSRRRSRSRRTRRTR